MERSELAVYQVRSTVLMEVEMFCRPGSGSSLYRKSGSRGLRIRTRSADSDRASEADESGFDNQLGAPRTPRLGVPLKTSP